MKERLMKNNLGLKILAFLTAVLLWLIVVNIDDPVTNKTFSGIPVTVINQEILAKEQQTFQIVDDTQEVNVTISAKRSVLNRIEPKDISAIADMKELALKSQIPITVNVKEYSYKEAYATPRNLQVRLEKEEVKKFPIVPKTKGVVRDGYVLGNIQADPEKVTIRGPKSVINKITRVEATVNVSGLSEDAVLKSELVLYDENNNVIDQKLLANNLGIEGVNVKVELLHTKNVPVEFDTSQIEAASGYAVAGIKYEPQEILVAGSSAQLHGLHKIIVPSSALEMSGVYKKTEKIIDISKYLPEGLSLVDENAGSVVVTISVEKDGTKAYDITVGVIRVDNLNSRFTMQYENVDALELQIRGPKAVLEALDIDKAVSIDLKDYKEEGTYDVPVQVELPAKCVLEQPVHVRVIIEKKQ